MTFEEWYEKEYSKRQTERNPLTVGQALWLAWCAAEKEQAARVSNLLAVIHRDGGHYEQEHGTEKAVADALVLLPRLIQSQEAARTDTLNEAAQVADKILSEWAMVPQEAVGDRIRALIDKPAPPTPGENLTARRGQQPTPPDAMDRAMEEAG